MSIGTVLLIRYHKLYPLLAVCYGWTGLYVLYYDMSADVVCQVSAFLEIHDIAGLVRGAHQGQGLGNSFLSHIRAVDGIFHVLRKMIPNLLCHHSCIMN